MPVLHPDEELLSGGPHPLARLAEQGTALAAALALLLATAWPAPTLAAAQNSPFSTTAVAFQYDEALAQYIVDSATLTPLRRSRIISADHIPLMTGPIVAGASFRVVATAYASTPGQTSGNPFITASGALVSSDAIAANFLPLGAVIRFQGRRYTVRDRMNSRYDNRAIIDIWHASNTAARQFGVRLLEIEIVSLPEEKKAD